MPPTNDFVPFCNENTGTNLPTQAAYLANPALPIGNQPGIASSSLNNKAIRQGSTIAAVLAQYVVNQTGAGMIDDQNSADHVIPAALLGALTAAMKVHSPVLTKYLSGSGTHNLTYKFQIATGSATAGATYSDGTTTYTVALTVAAGIQLNATGAAAPSAIAGTLTKTSGAGDATLTYYAYRAPIYINVRAQGGGGGGGGSATTAGNNGGTGGAGGSTTFGTTLIVASGGTGGLGTQLGGGGGGGSASLGTGVVGNAFIGAGGAPNHYNAASEIICGAQGASSPAGGAGAGGIGNSGPGGAAAANTGSGGGGAGGPTSGLNGGGGGAGGFVDGVIFSSSAAYHSTYAYAVGAAGTAGAAGTTGAVGGVGAAGFIEVIEYYQ